MCLKHKRSLFVLFLMIVFISGCLKKDVDSDTFRGKNVVAEKKSRILKHIADPTKKAHLLVILDKAEHMLREFSLESKDYRQKVQTLTADYDTRREDFEEVASDFNIKAETLLKNLIDQGVAMRKLTTPEEWKKISKKKSIFGSIKEEGTCSSQSSLTCS